MLDHISLGVSDLAVSIAFYDAVLTALGYTRVWSDEDAAGYGYAGGDDNFAIKQEPAATVPAIRRLHVAFAAPDRESVIKFYAAALAHGAVPDGPPELHPMYGEKYFAAFVGDPDGYRLEAVCHA